MSGANGHAAPDPPQAIFRFADPQAVDTLVVPGCHCQLGTHTEETITYRTQLGAGEWESCNAAGLMAGEGDYVDYGVSNDMAIAKSVEEWTLVTNIPCVHPKRPHGAHEIMPISRRTVTLLDDDIRQAILARIKEAQDAFAGQAKAGPLPPPSGARSQGSSRASASRTRTTPRPA